MGAADYRAYLDLLKELGGCLDKLAGLSQQKAETVRQDDLMAMDAVLKQEQAVGLAIRGLELRRVKLMGQLGLENVPLAQLAEHYPPELFGEAKQTAEGLRQSYQIYRSSADMARNLLELNLHQIEKFIAASGVDPAEAGAGYEAPGAEPPRNMKTDFRA